MQQKALNPIEKIRTGIYLIMCTLFVTLIYAYFYEVLVKNLYHDSASRYIGCVLVMIIILCDYLCRKYITNFITYMLIHLAFIAATVIIPRIITDKVILSVIACSFLIMAIGYWRSEEESRNTTAIEVPLGLTLFFVLAYIHSSISFSRGLSIYCYIAGIAYFILYYIREYIEKFQGMLAANEKNSKEIYNSFSVNFSLVMMFNAIIVFIIAIAGFLYSGALFNKLWLIVQKLLHRIFSVFKNGNSAIESEIPTEVVTGSSTQETVYDPYVENPPHSSKFLATLFNVFVVIVFIAIFFTIIYLLYVFIKNHMSRYRNTDDIVEKVKKEIKTERPPKERKQRNFSLFTSNRDKVRKLYAERVDFLIKQNRDIIVRNSHTPLEIKETVNKNTGDSDGSFATLTDIYEKARYSDKEITKEDVEMAKR